MSGFLQTDREQRTRELAYEHWVKRGRPFGSPETDWFAAERQCADSGISTRDNTLSLYEYSMEPIES